ARRPAHPVPGPPDEIHAEDEPVEEVYRSRRSTRGRATRGRRSPGLRIRERARTCVWQGGPTQRGAFQGIIYDNSQLPTPKGSCSNNWARDIQRACWYAFHPIVRRASLGSWELGVGSWELGVVYQATGDPSPSST